MWFLLLMQHLLWKKEDDESGSVKSFSVDGVSCGSMIDAEPMVAEDSSI